MAGRRAAALLLTIMIATTGLTAAPASACTIVAQRLIRDPDGSVGVLQAQRNRAIEQRAGIEYAREINAAVNAREASVHTNYSYDLARMLMPNLVQPVVTAADSGGDCGPPEAGDVDVSGQEEFAEAVAAIRLAARLPGDAPVGQDAVERRAVMRLACNDEVRRDLADYLSSAVSVAQLRNVWRFIVPRAGMSVPHDGAEPVTGGRLTAIRAGDPVTLAFVGRDARPYIGRRQQRGWQFLSNHRDGQAVMTAITIFLTARIAHGRAEAVLCPATMQVRSLTNAAAPGQ